MVGVCYDTIPNYTPTRWNANYNLHETVENPIRVYERVSKFYDDILPKYKDKNILVIAHSGIARMTYFYFKGKPKDNDFTDFEIKNAHILQIEN